MAVDKLVDSTQLDADLTSVANAIRTKGGTSAQMAFPAGFVSAVQAIPTGITPTGTKQISITQNGTTTEDVTNYASAEITVSVPNTYSAGDEGKVVSNGALVAQSSDTVTTNNTYDTTLINSLTVNVSGGGGGGATTIASGSFVGSNSQIQTFAIGTKMAQTDVFVKVLARSNSEFAYDTSYKFANLFGIVFSGVAHFDLSTNGSEKAPVSDLSYPVNNSGTITNVVAGDSLRGATNIRNASSTVMAGVNQFRVNKTNSGFELYIGHSNASYKFPSTITYDYEVVYFGSNPSTDIVEVS